MRGAKVLRGQSNPDEFNFLHGRGVGRRHAPRLVGRGKMDWGNLTSDPLRGGIGEEPYLGPSFLNVGAN